MTVRRPFRSSEKAPGYQFHWARDIVQRTTLNPHRFLTLPHLRVIERIIYVIVLTLMPLFCIEIIAKQGLGRATMRYF